MKSVFQLILDPQILFCLPPGNELFPLVTRDRLIQLAKVFQVLHAFAQSMQLVVHSAQSNFGTSGLFGLQNRNITHKLPFDLSQRTPRFDFPPNEITPDSCRCAADIFSRQPSVSSRRRPSCFAIPQAFSLFACANLSVKPATAPWPLPKSPA